MAADFTPLEVSIWDGLTGEELLREHLAAPGGLIDGAGMTITWDSTGCVRLTLPESRETLPPAAEPG